MTVCKFWRQGNCKFGDSCRFEHPPGLKGSGSQQDAFMKQAPTQPNNNNNNFSQQPPRGPQGFNSNNQRNNNSSNYRGGRNARDPQPYGVTREMLDEDLMRERPMWIMSSYGPGRDPDIQLFGGFPLEQSQEEVRVLHYQAMAAGNPQASAQVEAELAQKSNEQVQAVLNDVSGALHYLSNGHKEHPNRNDICKQGTSNLKRNGDGPFSVQNRRREINAQQRNFGSSGFGQQPGPGFASQQAGFGQAPMNSQQGQFGNQMPSGFGQNPQTAGFGSPQNGGVGGVGGFGSQPPAGGFGTSDQPMGSPQLGQPSSGFGIQSNNPAFPQPQQQAPNNTFGQAAPQPQQHANSFLNPPSLPQQQQGPLGLQFSSNPDNQPPPQTMNGGFGQQPPQISNSINPSQQQNGFAGNPTNNGEVNSYTTRDASNKLLTWKGRPVNYVNANEPCYNDENGSLVRIWFPDGQPYTSGSKGTQAGAHSDIKDYSSKIAEQYGFLKEHGNFKDGIIPEAAPIAEMVRWDL